MANRVNLKLGKGAPKIDSKRLMLRDYLTSALPPPPKAVDWTKGSATNFGYMLNNDLGDCVIAAIGHAIQIWSLNVGTEITVPDSQIEHYYEIWAGYVPGNPNTDNGYVIVDALNKWRAQKFDGHTLIGYADPDLGNQEHIKQSVALFGVVDSGLALPVTAQTQDVWEVVGDGKTGNSAPGSWGLHSAIIVGFAPFGPLFLSWGETIPASWAFAATYCDELHTLLGGRWLLNGPAPSGFRMNALLADLPEIAA
jgi:hypothetical protein